MLRQAATADIGGFAVEAFGGQERLCDLAADVFGMRAIDGCSPFVRNIVFAAVHNGAVIVSGAAYRTYRTPELLLRILPGILVQCAL